MAAPEPVIKGFNMIIPGEIIEGKVSQRYMKQEVN
jgi:hypothetical protein